MGVVGVCVVFYFAGFLDPRVIFHGPKGVLSFDPDGVEENPQRGGLGIWEMSCKGLMFCPKEVMITWCTVVKPVLVCPSVPMDSTAAWWRAIRRVLHVELMLGADVLRILDSWFAICSLSWLIECVFTSMHLTWASCMVVFSSFWGGLQV